MQANRKYTPKARGSSKKKKSMLFEKNPKPLGFLLRIKASE